MKHLVPAVPARLVLLHLGAIGILAGGMFTTWAGAVRWQTCWGMTRCDAMGDQYAEAYRDGLVPPLVLSAACLAIGMTCLAASAGRRPQSILGVVGGITYAALTITYPRTMLDPTGTTGDITFLDWVSVFPLSGLLAVAGAWSAVLARHRVAQDRVEVTAWTGYGLAALTTSLWMFYFVPQTWADSWDDPTWMWSFDGTLTLAVGAWLLWSAGRTGQAVATTSASRSSEATSPVTPLAAARRPTTNT